ncbi:hypothetical protein [Metabacillus fastidiosus]|uniref:KTSC domain-containing protein n=1 Tax=Metabacillus fastidiosus TaxID=1458 RepID=A0ABU6NTQ4_9BACI|nr:hypothetical protein [Metabacillus fastidiosus]
MRIGKSVSFNTNDPYEYTLFLFSEQQGYFSKYVKRLIQRDMESRKEQFFNED